MNQNLPNETSQNHAFAESVAVNLSIEQLLEIAVTFRPDLESVRVLVEAVSADREALWWGGFGPTLSLAYQYGGITGHTSSTDGTESFSNNLIVNPTSPSGCRHCAARRVRRAPSK